MTVIRMPTAEIAVAVLIATLATCSGPAYADDDTVVLPPNTYCTLGQGDDLVTWLLEERRFCATRDKVERANARDAAAAACERRLGEALDSNRRLLEADREPGWWTALRWGGIGAAIGGAFVAGALLF